MAVQLTVTTNTQTVNLSVQKYTPAPFPSDATIPDYADITSLLANQGIQVDEGVYGVIDASADTNITFPIGETRLQAYYQFLGVATGDIDDYRLVSAPYGNGGSNGYATPEKFKTDDNSWAEAFQLAIDSDNKYVLFDGTYILDKPVYLASNKTYTNNGNISLADAQIDDILEDVLIGETIIKVTDAESKYKVGQQIVFYDTNRTAIGGNPGRVGKNGIGSLIISINGNDIEIEEGLAFNITVSADARVGTINSLFICDGKEKITFTNNGIINGNCENQFLETIPSWIDNITVNRTLEAITYGACVAIKDSEDFKLSGVGKIIGATLHGVVIWNSDNCKILDLLVESCMSKNILILKSTGIRGSNVTSNSSIYEDGIAVYNFSKDVFIDNLKVNGNNRNGIFIRDSDNVFISPFVSSNNGYNVYMTNGRNLILKGICEAGGVVEATSTAGPSIMIQSNNFDIELDVTVKNLTEGTRAIQLQGENADLNLKLNYADGKLSSEAGTGILFAGNTKNVIISESFLYNNKKDISVFNDTYTIENVLITNCSFEGSDVKIDNGDFIDNLIIRSNIGLLDSSPPSFDGTVIPLDDFKVRTNTVPEWNATYTVGNKVKGGAAIVLITTLGQTEFPEITGATLLIGSDFEADAIFEMTVYTLNGTDVYYFFLFIEEVPI